MFKKAVSYIFVFIFLFNAMGYFIAFSTMQYDLKTRVRTAIKQGVNPDRIVPIVFEKSHLKNIEWIKEGAEFIFNNNRYDVINTSEYKDSITFYCINDREETILYADLENHVNSYVVSNKPFKSRSLKKFLKNGIKLFFAGEAPFTELNFTEKRLPVHITAIFYRPPQITPTSPPPELSRI